MDSAANRFTPARTCLFTVAVDALMWLNSESLSADMFSMTVDVVLGGNAKAADPPIL